MKWHIHTAGRKEGPYSTDELRAKLSAGAFAGEVFVWKEDFTTWKKLSEVPELAALQQKSASSAPAKKGTGDLSVFTEMPKAAAEKTGVIDGSLLKNLKKEAKNAEKITKKENKKNAKPAFSPETKKKLLLIPIGILAIAAGGGAYYYFNRPKPIELPPIADVDPQDYQRLKTAVSAPIDQIGPRLEIAHSTEDVAHPHFYIATNLPDTAQVDITVKQVPGTAVEPSTTPVVVHLNGFSGHLGKSDKITVSPGEYTVVVTGGPNAKMSLAASKMFLGGVRDAAYQTSIEQARGKRRERAEAELRDMNQGIAQMDTFQLLIEKQTELSKSPVINQKVLNSFHDFQKSWEETEKALPTRSEFWRPDATESNVVYPQLLGLGRTTWREQQEINNLLKGFFAASPQDRPKLLQPLTDQINKATQSFAVLKAEIAKVHPQEIQ